MRLKLWDGKTATLKLLNIKKRNKHDGHKEKNKHVDHKH